jgi:ribA/ribD-fused uncharacterized protein
MSQLEERVIKMESQSRRDNLLIDGIQQISPENCVDIVRGIFTNRLKLENAESFQIVRCHRLGAKRKDSKKPRTIIIKFQWYGDLMNVWRARKHLKGTNIYINEDFPKEIQDRRYILRPILKKAIANGKEAFLNVDVLVIDGKRYTTKDIHKLPEGLDPAKLATPQIGDDIVAFFGSQSPLSNFYITEFSMNGIIYDCQERHYVRGKAEYANRPDLLSAVMEASSPSDCKRISTELDKIIDLDDWHKNHAAKIMTDGVKAKFEQNENIRNFLLATGEKTLVEANPYDKHWSCGFSLKDTAKILDVDNWPGDNELGNILMDTRNAFRV